MLKDPTAKKVLIVIDALDECEATTRPAFFRFLSTIRAISKIRIVVTSREAYEGLHDPLLINLDNCVDHSSQDFDLYIDLEVNKLALRRQLDPDLRQKIKVQLK